MLKERGTMQMNLTPIGTNFDAKFRTEQNDNLKKIGQGLSEATRPVTGEKLASSSVSESKLVDPMKNKVYRGVYQVTQNISDAIYNSTDKSYTVSFNSLRIFKAAGYTIQTVNPAKNIKIPQKQALVVDLSQTGVLTPYVTTGAGYVSGTEHGKDAFTDDTKLILLANYNGEIHGPLANNVIQKLDSEQPLEPIVIGDGMVVKKTKDIIDIYIKGGNNSSSRYIHYPLRHFVKELDRTVAASNFDIWKVEECYEVEKGEGIKFSTKKQLVLKGEWELAIREKSASDSIGGNTHGDEVMTSVTLLVNGVKRDIDTTENFACETLTLIVHSDLYRDNTITPEGLVKFGEHLKYYNFNREGMEIYQEVKFSLSTTLTFGYLSMLPIFRKDKSGVQITDEAYRDDDYKIYDVSTEGFTHKLFERTPGIKQAWIYGKESGISATVEILDRNVWLPNENMRVDNPAAYNKFYFDFCGNNYKTEVGEVWKQRSRFKIDTGN